MCEQAKPRASPLCLDAELLTLIQKLSTSAERAKDTEFAILAHLRFLHLQGRQEDAEAWIAEHKSFYLAELEKAQTQLREAEKEGRLRVLKIIANDAYRFTVETSAVIVGGIILVKLGYHIIG